MTPVNADAVTAAGAIPHRAGAADGGLEGDREASLTSAFALARDTRVAAALVATLVLALAIAAIPPWPVGVFQDDGIYAILGKALATGEGYRYINLPGSPYATHYPPGYPVFLALLWTVAPEFPQNVAVFTFANAGFLALAAYATFRFARGRLGLSTLGAAVVAIAGTVSVPALIFGVFVLSEPMFMAFLVPVLILAERAAERGGWREAFVAGAAAGVLAMVRTTGTFVAPALVLVLLARRRLLAAMAAAAACAVFVLPWSVWVAQHGAEVPRVLVGKYGPYDTWLTDAIRAHGAPFVRDVVVRNARALGDLAWVMFTGGEASPKVLHVPAAVGVAAVLAAGTWRLARRAPVTAWFLAAYMALVIVWPFEPTRFVWALLPIFGAIMALGMSAVIARAPATVVTRLARGAALAACGLLLAGFGAYNVRGLRQGWRDAVPRETTTRATPAVEWVRAATRPGDVVAMEDDPLIYLYTGRRAVPVSALSAEEYLHGQTYDFATEQMRAILAHYRPTYVIGTTSYAVVSARNLSMRAPPELRVYTLLPTAAIFTPVAP